MRASKTEFRLWFCISLINVAISVYVYTVDDIRLTFISALALFIVLVWAFVRVDRNGWRE